jgi:hypothetical protein
MDTLQVLIAAVTLALVVGEVAYVRYRMRHEELAAEDRRMEAQAAAGIRRREAEDDAAALAAAARERGPADGTKVAVHVGPHLVQGKRVLRGEPEADGWIVLDDADLIEGTRSTPLGGRQWLPGTQWLQEL